jgi:DNA polymerase-3 subunit delta
VEAAVADSARYDLFQLGEAALDGDAGRAIRVLEGLRAEGTEPPLVLWALCRELRSLAAARNGAKKSPPYGEQAKRREALVARAAERLRGTPLEPWFAAAARIDLEAKGQARGEPWISLTALVAELAGARVPRLPAA